MARCGLNSNDGKHSCQPAGSGAPYHRSPRACPCAWFRAVPPPWTRAGALPAAAGLRPAIRPSPHPLGIWPGRVARQPPCSRVQPVANVEREKEFVNTLLPMKQGPHFDPTDPAVALDPYPTYAALREATPVWHSPLDGTYFITRHADVHEASRPKLLGLDFGDREGFEGVGRVWEDPRNANFAAFERWDLIALEPPDHTKLRRLVLSAFTPRAVDATLAGRVAPGAPSPRARCHAWTPRGRPSRRHAGSPERRPSGAPPVARMPSSRSPMRSSMPSGGCHRLPPARRLDAR